MCIINNLKRKINKNQYFQHKLYNHFTYINVFKIN